MAQTQGEASQLFHCRALGLAPEQPIVLFMSCWGSSLNIRGPRPHWIKIPLSGAGWREESLGSFGLLGRKSSKSMGSGDNKFCEHSTWWPLRIWGSHKKCYCKDIWDLHLLYLINGSQVTHCWPSSPAHKLLRTCKRPEGLRLEQFLMLEKIWKKLFGEVGALFSL
jgi:hypothetical protein